MVSGEREEWAVRWWATYEARLWTPILSVVWWKGECGDVVKVREDLEMRVVCCFCCCCCCCSLLAARMDGSDDARVTDRVNAVGSLEVATTEDKVFNCGRLS